MRRIFNAYLCALVLLGGALVQGQGVAHAAEEQQSITLVSGASGTPGSPDPLITASLDGETFVPAVITEPHPVYDTLPGTQWVTIDGSGDATVRYRLPFTLPPGAVGPSLVADVHADNYAEVILNGTSLGTQSSSGDVANFQNPPEQFSTDAAANFVTGENHLDILVTDQGPPAGLDVSAVVRYTPEGESTPTPPTVSIADADVTEGDSGTPTAALTVSIDPPSTQTTSVTVSTANGTAGSGDYVGREPYRVTFDANQTTATVSVPVVPDTTLERDETFSVVLSEPTGDLVLGDGTGLVTIFDDDPLTLSIGDASGPEGGNVDLPISFSSPALDSGSVLASTGNGSASAPGDFAPVLGRIIAWEAGATRAKVRIAAANDDLFEGPETFSVSLADPEGAVIGVGSATGTIVDTDGAPAPPVVSIADTSTVEGDPGGGRVLDYVVSVDPVQSAAVTVDATAVTGTVSGADIGSPNQTVTIAAGQSSGHVLVPIKGDLLDEPNETLRMGLSNLRLGGFPAGQIATASAVGTIVDDDPSQARLTISNATASEGDPDTPGVLTFSVSLSARTIQKAPVSVTVETVSGTAGGPDYVGGTQTFTIPAGASSAPFSVAVKGDVFDEPNETMGVHIVSATVTGVGPAAYDRRDGTGTINDDDPAPPRLTISNATATEGDAGTEGVLGFGLSIDFAQKSPVSVTVETVAGTANGSDYVHGTQTVTIAPGVKSATLSIPLKGDLVSEPQEKMTAHVVSAQLVGVPTGPGTGSVSITRSDGTGTINDDDPVAPRLTISNATATEGDPGTAGVLAFGLTIDVVQKAPVSVTVETVAGTANGSDYVPDTQTVTIAPGAKSAILSIPLKGDLVSEPQEKMTARIVSARLVGVTTGPGVSTVTINRSHGEGTINDDDPIPPAWTVSNASVLEGDPGSASVLRFIIDIDRAQKEAVSIGYQATAGTAQAGDFQAVTGSVTIPVGSKRVTVDVPVVADIAVEGDETVKLTLHSPSLGRINRGQGIGTIKDDDAFPFVSILDGQGAEGTEFDGTASFVVRLDHASADVVEVDFATALNGKVAGAASGNDLTMTSGTVTFAPGETERIINVVLHADSLVEVDEHFTVQLTAVRGAKFGDRTATGLIGNDDGSGSGPDT